MNMAHDPQEPQTSASCVCMRCKTRKKRCDKALPSCSRCTRYAKLFIYGNKVLISGSPRLQVICKYENPEPQGESTRSEPGKHNSTMHVAVHYGRNISLFPELITPSTFIAPQPAFPVREEARMILDLDEQLTEQACDITSRDGDDIAISCSRYFITIHCWYPIIAKEELYERLEHLRSSPNADFTILVLTIYLVSRMYRQSLRPRDGLEKLYHTVKSFHSILLSTGRLSMDLVQAGLLLALYEHCQALHGVTYQTLGVCARMGYALGFHKTISPDIFPDTGDNSVIERQRQVWWCIITLERYVYHPNMIYKVLQDSQISTLGLTGFIIGSHIWSVLMQGCLFPFQLPNPATFCPQTMELDIQSLKV